MRNIFFGLPYGLSKQTVMEYWRKLMPEVATNDRLVRQESLNLTLPKAVAVVGCGGVGSWLALTLALAGVKCLWLFDHDVVSSSNLNRLPVLVTDEGKPKTEAIKFIITQLRPDCEIYCMGRWTTDLADGIKLAESCDWIAVTTDTLASRREIYDWVIASNSNAPRVEGKYKYRSNYIEAAAEGEFGSATGIPAEWATELEVSPGYASVPVWIGPCMTSAYIAAAHILHNKPMHDAQWRIGFDAKKGVDCFQS